MSTCKYGDEANVRTDTTILQDIISRQGTELLLDTVAEYIGTVVNTYSLEARDRERLVASTCQLLHEALLERT